ncbi:MAG TPA: glycosyltransferase family 4 protein [Actinomycetota bacterium]
MPPSSVLMVAGPSTGGIRRHVLLLRDELRSRGFDVTVASPVGVAEPDVLLSFRPGALPRDLGALARAAARADVVHAHGLKAGWLAVLARARPLVLTVHNVVPAGSPLAFLQRALPRFCSHVIATAGDVARAMGARATTTVIPAARPGVRASRPRAEVRSALGIDPAAPMLVCVARLHPQKDLTTFLGVVSKVHEAEEDVRAVIVGEGPAERDVRAEIRQRGLGEVVAMAGRRDDAPDVIAAADVLVVSSRWESGPFVLAEAAELGTPAVSTRVGWAERLLPDELLAPAGDPRALAEAVVTVLADPDPARFAKESLARASFLDTSPLVDDVVEVYRAVTR